MHINISRLMRDIEAYAEYGKEKDGGVNRPSFSAADYQLRELFAQELEELGMNVSVDAIANVWGTFPGNGEKDFPLVIGSHLDTVPNGGKYDGALGVLVAKEIVQTLRDQHITLAHPLEIVSFTAEEANEFNFSTMGSRAFNGKLSSEELYEAKDSTGRTLAEAVEKAGGKLSQIGAAKQKTMAAYFELHIEQGRKLEKENLSVGIVDSIVGIYRDLVTIEGEQNHSGTTIMESRKDALVAASEMVAQVQKLALDLASDTVATVGKFEVFPNSANIIPGRVEFTLEVRSSDKQERESLVQHIHDSFYEIKNRHGVKMSVTNSYNTQECDFDKQLIELLEDAAVESGIPYKILPSMAGHDAMNLAPLTKTAMVFVKSIGGISHSPQELSLPEDIEKGANILLNALLKADKVI
ncbi:Zn-dependent hydrolase [Planococcus sp. CPCC 101016]|uniref:Zn-dependent hydrolase n=1 Tax=Planococcus sp. CPCC 101016 TaxID=2599617 RepID=UPI0011B60D94|nr:Zn-dependent hydrolase [Planococcus sp. CPCC 101016]TWT06736.1 Zn-dependent hydrolase [Planococcus sp. CPCC 101016]